jgi:hypothetical protein
MTLPGSAAQAKGSGLSFSEEALEGGLEMDERSEHASRGGLWLQRVNKISVSDKRGSPIDVLDTLYLRYPHTAVIQKVLGGISAAAAGLLIGAWT